MASADPYTWGGIDAANYGLYPSLLMKAGLWDRGVTGNPFGSENDGGAAPAYSVDPSAWNGYQVGQYVAGGVVNQALRDAQGNIVQTHQFSQPHSSLTGSDYGTMAAIAAAVIGGGYGLQGLGAGEAAGAGSLAGGADTAALGAGQVGALDAGAAAGSEAGAGYGGSLSFSAPGLGAPSAGGAFAAPTAYAVPALDAGAAAGGGLGQYASAIKAAASLVGGLGSAYASGQAGQQASQLQQQAATAGQAQLAPYATAGTGALKAQQDLAGLNGPQAQQAAIAQLQQSPEFTSKLDLGNRSILANASATGGLRGGNTQAALAQFSPQLLAQTINDQYSRLGGLTQTGLSAAGGVSNLIQQGGAAAAGGALAGGKQQAGYWGALGNAAGWYAGLSGW
jgi:hypothetical protein